MFAAASNHSYSEFASAIDEAFARWDRSHLHEFAFADGTRIGTPNADWNNEAVLDETGENLSRLQTSQQFIYVFDFGDDWTHLWTVVEAGINPHEALGLVPNVPLPYFGRGNIPDQYGRAWDGDDAEPPPPIDPKLTDLPPLRPGWGPSS